MERRRGSRRHHNDVFTTCKYMRTKVDSHVKYGLASHSSGARARRSLVPQTGLVMFIELFNWNSIIGHYLIKGSLKLMLHNNNNTQIAAIASLP